MPKLLDKTGQKFGKLTVLSRAENKGKKVYWNCKCDCGKILAIRGDKLVPSQDPDIPSCGCTRIERVKESIAKKYEGLRFGRLIVIKETEQRTSSGSILWLCQCDCGNTTLVSSDCLTRGITRSCGCLQKNIAKEQMLNIVEKKKMQPNTVEKGFFIEKTEIRNTNAGSPETWAYAKCPYCGTFKWIPAHYIRTEDTQSCGCLRSRGEEKIKKLLATHNIPFEEEKTFDSCRSLTTNYKYRFDFYVNNQFLIEYDGEQHFKPAQFGGISIEEAKENLHKTQQRDLYKNQWCKNNNIPLIRIPYTHLDKLQIEDLLLETSQFLINSAQ